jgi:hypothetical protein
MAPHSHGFAADTRAFGDDAYRSAYALAAAEATRTKPIAARKNAAKKLLRNVAAEVAKVISGNRDVSDALRLSLGLVVNTKPSPILPPPSRPGVSVVSVVTRTVTIRISDLEALGKRRKPHGVMWTRIYTHIGAEMPENIREWKYAGETPRHTMELTFRPDIGRGTQVWICACWVNRKAQHGPLSNPIATIVQGGLSAAG